MSRCGHGAFALMAAGRVSAIRPTGAVRLAPPSLLLCALSLASPIQAAPEPDTPPKFEVPAPPAGTPLRFVAYGDTRFTDRPDVVNTPARRALVHQISLENPALILIGGDLVYEGSNPQDYAVYRNDTRDWSEGGLRVFPVLGNHEFKGCEGEDKTACLDNWWQNFSSLSLKPYRWYSVDIGPSLVALILDSDSPLKPGSTQRAWFERQIGEADARAKFILVVMHYPPVRDPFYPAGRDEKEIARYFARKSKSMHAQVVVIGSHVHNYERYRRNGITYLVTGGGGAKPVPALRMFGELSQLKTAVNFHYIRFELQNDRLLGTMVRFDENDQSGNPWTEPDRFTVNARR